MSEMDYLLGKSMVGAGAYRKITEMSPQARKVLRRLDTRSGYAMGAKPGGDYDQTFAAARGRKLRMPLRGLAQRAQAKAEQVAAQRGGNITIRPLQTSSRTELEANSRYNQRLTQ